MTSINLYVLVCGSGDGTELVVPQPREDAHRTVDRLGVDPLPRLTDAGGEITPSRGSSSNSHMKVLCPSDVVLVGSTEDKNHYSYDDEPNSEPLCPAKRFTQRGRADRGDGGRAAARPHGVRDRDVQHLQGAQELHAERGARPLAGAGLGGVLDVGRNAQRVEEAPVAALERSATPSLPSTWK
jgi:hypothetical protein